MFFDFLVILRFLASTLLLLASTFLFLGFSLLLLISAFNLLPFSLNFLSLCLDSVLLLSKIPDTFGIDKKEAEEILPPESWKSMSVHELVLGIMKYAK